MNYINDNILLPGVLQELSELIGIANTLKLVERYGGTCSLYIPKKIQNNHELIKIVGHESAQKICQRFGGESHFEIPKAKRLELMLQNIRIKQDKEKLSRVKLALKYNLTERQITKILGKPDLELGETELNLI